MSINSSESTVELTQLPSAVRRRVPNPDKKNSSHQFIPRIHDSVVQYQTQRESLLEAIAQRICQCDDLNTILNETVRELRRFLGCDRVLIYQLESNMSGIIAVEASVTASSSLLGKTIADPCFAEKYAERYKRRCIQVIEDIYAAGLAPCYIDLLKSIEVRANIVVPILFKQQLWGLLTAQQSYKPRQWHQTEIDLLKQVTTHLEIAVQQAQLQQQVKNLQVQLEVQKQESEKLERLKQEFLRTLSHELKTPITSIHLAVQTMESVLKQEGLHEVEMIPQLLHILHKECRRESKLINDLLSLTYLEAEIDPLTLIPIDLQSWLPAIVEPFRELASCQQQQLTLNIANDIPLLETEIADLERILTELLNNACKFTPAGGTIIVSTFKTADTVVLSVSNSGVEIAAIQQLKIFDPFYRIPNNDPWKYSGTGLGLALVQKLAKHMGALIDVESTSHKTTFTLRFPYYDERGIPGKVNFNS
ncbi:GAF domain-containing protein [Scytonema sp. UIC 10036]|uniref:GAF domain-containing sensor histidine kinase n=1 Tax=Scytonema sp. UIC 10036 TaxID=2304196 RepID=UPI0012DA2738|nr:GAF domain-containing sensor histidine kinase [Scytonema sp. UIC 10036]MUG92352.1 GAF domain-containing protein [Scytonema sp. UIC 10036]